MPLAPDPTPWAFPHHSTWDPDDDLVALGADLEAGTLLTAYSLGLFPMPVTLDREELGWFSPVERGVLPLAGLKVSRSLRRAARDFEIRVDTAFDEVMAQCGSPVRPDGWITPEFVRSYTRLHHLGWAHSVEAWRDGRLAGGLYGVSIGGLFAGESMFHRDRDASKVALLGLVELLRDEHADERVLDVQWQTPHLASLGVVRRPRGEYLEALERCLHLPLPAAFRMDD
ncbi:leucyl/phenylalanyl-tRNA--protein transferase [Nocardioides sp. Root122]|uniref:leucyl/phenylalanyl-tRNA--protein transferase n=1 Tax=Nocardioides TaxID=1839 RepID=UPI0007030B71|nr:MULTISPECIES: leucyl/phenylalanyl-tRNA--protein transferase [Nocardioides]KQV64282.1 leucyl/phenylalanyl-tRNA--protein transferase [Nocardioides sp. Root122]MCK9824834.1 leucyl/phenylalanyl-tRNA--protein transferase [Nocardioides cavernae]